MTRRRWIADEADGNRAALTGDNARHLARVLRAKVGERFDIAVGSEVRQGTVASVSETQVEFELGEAVQTATSGAQIELLLAVFKFDRMEWAIEKATELGVSRIIPVIARRTDAHLATAAAKRVERWRKIAHEASQQSRRISPPEIAEPVKLKAALESVGEAGNKILLSEEEKAVSLGEAIKSGSSSESLILAIGPEGGWTPDEAKLFAEHGWVSASMGPRILRAETAAIAALAIAGTSFPQSQ